MKIEIVNQYSLVLTQVKNLSLNLFRLYNAMQRARKAETALQQALADMEQMRSSHPLCNDVVKAHFVESLFSFSTEQECRILSLAMTKKPRKFYKNVSPSVFWHINFLRG